MILLLQAEDNLNRSITLFDIYDAFLELDSHLCSILVNVCSHIFTVDILLCESLLIATKRSQDSSCARVDFGATIAYDTNNDLLPCVFSPSLARFATIHILDIFYDT